MTQKPTMGPRGWGDPLVRRGTLHEDLVTRLTEMIQEGELPPGSRLPEVALCEHFGVSRTPLREALKVLAADGWLVWRANYGARVSEVDIDEVREVFEVLGGLETLIGSLVAVRIPDEGIARLVALHEDLARLHAREDRIGYFKQNQAIHGFLAEAAGNRTLRDSYAALSKKVYRARTMANYGHDRWDQSLGEHLAFMEALARRDRDDLAAKLRAHNDATCAAVIGALSMIQA